VNAEATPLRYQSCIGGSAVFKSGGNFPPQRAGPIRPAPANPIAIGLVGFMRVRRHPHHRARSAPPCGVSCGPRAYRVRVPIVAIVQAASGGSVDVISVIVWNSVRDDAA